MGERMVIHCVPEDDWRVATEPFLGGPTPGQLSRQARRAGAIGPTDLPKIRDDVRVAVRQFVRGSPINGVDRDVLRQPMMSALSGDLYSVSAEMTQLALQAGVTLAQDFNLSEEDVPSPAGLICFAQPISADEQGTPIVGAAWSYWADEDEQLGGHRLSLLWIGDQAVHFGTNGGWVYGVRYAPADGDLIPVEGRSHADRLAEGIIASESPKAEIVRAHRATLKAAWLLMGQTLAEVKTARVGRTGSKRKGRSARPAEVRVIQLRRAQHEAGKAGQPRDWQHQWLVRGHWRMQPWGPKRERVRPVWITPHVKGPEGKPLLGGEKVYHLAR